MATTRAKAMGEGTGDQISLLLNQLEDNLLEIPGSLPEVHFPGALEVQNHELPHHRSAAGGLSRDDRGVNAVGEHKVHCLQPQGNPSRRLEKRADMGRPGRSFLLEDILFLSVLPRLPVKSLVRFKCVSKGWYDLISNNEFFISQQYQSCTSFPSLNFQRCGSGFCFVRDQRSLSFGDLLLHMRGCEIIASCNGLVAMVCLPYQILSSVYAGKPVRQPKSELFVGNPVCQDWKWIPWPWYCIPGTFGLVFDPLNSVTRYELVCLYRTGSHVIQLDTLEMGFLVFSSETGEWEASRLKIMVPVLRSLEKTPVFHSGIWYWRTDREDELLWYDTKKDCCGLIPLPLARVEGRLDYRSLNESNGYLVYSRVVNFEIEVWSMKDFKWSKSHHIRIQEIIERNPELFASIDHLGRLQSYLFPVASEGKMVFFRIGKVPFSYDAEAGEVMRYPSIPFLHCHNLGSQGDKLPFRCFLYKASLVPTPGKRQQIFPMKWEHLQPEKQGYICFHVSQGVLNISTTTAGDCQQ